MRPAARVQASIELLHEVLSTGQPADRVMANYFRARRYIGSKDKAAVSENLYTVLRNRSSFSYLLENSGFESNARFLVAILVRYQSLDLQEYFNGQQYSPSAFSPRALTALNSISFEGLESAPLSVRLNVPAWLEPQLKASLGERYEAEMQASNKRAQTDIRVNLLKSGIAKTQKTLADSGYTTSKTTLSPWGLRFDSRVALFGLDCFKQGWFEIQDQGSQVLAQLTNVQSGQTVVDFCAGAGGKTLAMAAMMQNKGSLYACDVHGKRLQQLSKRAKRAGVHNIRVQQLSTEHDKWVKKHRAKADVVLIDAPCSGTGTWRRSPDSRWNLSEQKLDSLVELQQSILKSSSRLVKPGGRLLYATCSLLNRENQHQIDLFLANCDEFELVNIELPAQLQQHESRLIFGQNSIQLLPGLSGTDGFFVCQMKRKEKMH